MSTTISAIALSAALLSTGSHADGCAKLNDLARSTFTASGAVLTAASALRAAGVMALKHSSGAWIVAGANGSYLPGTLGVTGAVVATLTHPLTLTVAGAALVVGGSAVVACNLAYSDRPPS